MTTWLTHASLVFLFAGGISTLSVATRNALAEFRLRRIKRQCPGIKFLTHHCGAMVPFFAERILSENDIHKMHECFKSKENLTLDYYRKFYADTAVSGSTPALMCGYAFFGVDKILFGTDMPFDDQLGDRATGTTIDSIERMAIPDSDKKKIFEDNAKKVFRLSI